MTTPAGDQGSSGSRAPATQVITRILQRDYTLGRTGQGQPFAVRNDVPSVLIPFTGSGGLRNRLAYDFQRETSGQRTAPSNALSEALAGAEGQTYAMAASRPSLRIARYRDALYLDLGRADGAAVELLPGRWHLVTRPPVLFTRTAMSGEIPLPEPPGDLDAARDLINIDGDGHWALYCACRVASLFPGITHPVELFTGPPGSAKTTTMRMTADWTDPSPAMIPVPRDGRTWSTIAASSYVLPVDNVSGIPVWWSDLLCKAASGDGWVDRALYTDGDVYVSAFQSVVLLNGITLGGLRGDLADRICLHVLAPPRGYRSDDELDARWQAARPAALAWLLDRTAEVMAGMLVQPLPVTASRLSRFEQIVRIVDSRWRTNAMAVWQSGRHDILEDVADSDAVAVALRAAIHAPVSLTATQLLDALRLHLPLSRTDWTPRLLSEHLERTAGALENLGWQMRRYREGGGTRTRKWMIVPPEAGNGHSVSWPSYVAPQI
ncbi:MAG: hypothetical protein ACRDOK_01785 [Streptosporangiaceae bacterium]